MHTPFVKKSWDKKMEEKRQLKALQVRNKELRAKHFALKREQQIRTKEKQERKKLNSLKSAKVQVVSNRF